MFLAAQTDETRVQVNFQEVMIPMRGGARLQPVIRSPTAFDRILATAFMSF